MLLNTCPQHQTDKDFWKSATYLGVSVTKLFFKRGTGHAHIMCSHDYSQVHTVYVHTLCTWLVGGPSVSYIFSSCGV